MRNVYFSFLGLGTYNPDTARSEYKTAVYELHRKKSEETAFVQVAEMELLGSSQFDLVLIAATQRSFDAHFADLKTGMEKFGARPAHVILEEDMTSEGQWAWFETLLAYIEPGDSLTIDLTHGYRAVPIVFSAAVNFFQKARNIRLKAVYYGVWERVKELGFAPIIDMKEFYLINEWAEAVGRLVDDADARKMAETAEKTSDFQAGELNDPDVIRTFDDLTNAIRNVDVNNISRKADAAVKLILEKKKAASQTGGILLDLVIDKFTRLTSRTPATGRYDRNYFTIQIEIIQLLLEHRLYMQAYTVMREFIASIGMLAFSPEALDEEEWNPRQRYAEVFVCMMNFPEKEWRFPSARKNDVKKLAPFYGRLQETGVESVLRSFSADLAKYRNGFDHAWTAMDGAPDDISEKGAGFLRKLKQIMALLEQHRFFASPS